MRRILLLLAFLPIFSFHAVAKPKLKLQSISPPIKRVLAPSSKAVPISQIHISVYWGLLLFLLEDQTTISVPMTYDGTPKKGNYKGTFNFDELRFTVPGSAGIGNNNGFIFEFPFPANVLFENNKSYDFLILDDSADTLNSVSSAPHIKATYLPRAKESTPVHPIPAPITILTQTEITYEFSPGPEATAVNQQRSYFWKISNPQQYVKTDGTPLSKDDHQMILDANARPQVIAEFTGPVLQYQWNQSGIFTVELTVRTCKELTFSIERTAALLEDSMMSDSNCEDAFYGLTQMVLTDRELMRKKISSVKPVTAAQYSNILTLMEFIDAHFTTDVQITPGHSIITAAQNPGPSVDQTRQFELTSSVPLRETVHWYAQYKSTTTRPLDLARQKINCHSLHIQSSQEPLFDLGVGNRAHFGCAEQGDWLILAKSETSPDKVLASYHLWITDANYIQKTQKFRALVKTTHDHVPLLDAKAELPVRALYLSRNHATPIQLQLFIGRSAQNPNEFVLLDLLPGMARMVYRGKSVQDVVATFEKGNKYPPGLILVQVGENPKAQLLDRYLVTTGDSSYQMWAGRFRWISVGVVVVGAVVCFIPPLGGPATGGYIISAGAVLGATGGAISLYDHLHATHISSLDVSIDILNIAANLASAGSMSLAANTVGGIAALGPQLGIQALTGRQAMRMFQTAMMTTVSGRAMVYIRHREQTSDRARTVRRK